MARKKNDLEWTDRELVHLLNEMNQSDEEAIVPLSDDEVAAIEDTYPEVAFSAERDKHQRAHLEELRGRWVAETEKIESLVHYAEERGLPPDELARRLRLGLDIIFKLQLRLLKDIPHRAIRSIADELEVNGRAVYSYLAMPPDMNQVAAVSEEKPKDTDLQSWDEAIAQSDMSDEDKEHWKKQTAE